MANAGLPTALLGAVVHSIDFSPAVMGTQFEFTHNPPLNFQGGFRGSIGISRGQAPYEVKLTFAVPAARDQFNFLARMAEQKSGGTGFAYDWWEGSEGIGIHWLLTGCFIGNFSMTNDPKQGTSTKSISIMGQVLKALN